MKLVLVKTLRLQTLGTGVCRFTNQELHLITGTTSLEDFQQYLTLRENNSIMEMLACNTRLLPKPSVMERVMIATGPKKPILLKNCLKSYYLFIYPISKCGNGIYK